MIYGFFSFFLSSFFLFLAYAFWMEKYSIPMNEQTYTHNTAQRQDSYLPDDLYSDEINEPVL